MKIARTNGTITALVAASAAATAIAARTTREIVISRDCSA
jgi:hypothetical protein